VPTDDELEAFAASIDAERAVALGRDFRSGEGRALAVLLGTAFPPLVPHAGWQVDAVAEIAREGWRTARSREDMLERFRGVVEDFADPELALSRLRRAVWLDRARIALRELFPAAQGGAGVEVTARELSDLASAALEIVLAEAEERIAQRYGQPRRADGRASSLVVLGMGKLGGLELNAGSDVDLVLVYDTDEGRSELELHDHWTRVARRMVQSFEAPGEDGAIWRVDLRLRPEGSQGPIVNSAAATERYYETWGRLWERAALLRARPVAGDAELGAQLEREIFAPFIYRHEVDPEIATALAELVQRSRSELSSAPERDLKLGRGGIREAEFFVQSLQLIWGGREPVVREPSTLKALGKLRSRGLVSDREARDIAWAYALLRRVEHRVQWMSGIQTHLLPEPAAELERLARSLGVDGGELLTEIGQARERVHSLFAALAPSAPRPPPGRRAALLFSDQPSTARELAGGTPAEAQHAPAVDLRHPEMIEHLRALAKRPDGLLGEQTRERHPEFADEVLDAVVDSADPEQAARYLRSLFGHFVSARAYISALARDELALRRLVTALGASAYVGDAVVGWPDLADVIVFGGAQISEIGATVAAELETFARDVAAESDAYERRGSFVSALRRAKSRITVEVAVADLAGQMGTRAATRVLSDLADAIIDRAADYELAGGTRPGSAEPLGLAVIAVGKLGGRDIGYGSDLDVLFVYDPERAPVDVDPGEYFVRRAQGIIKLISEPHPAGRGYELDTRLRPSGSHGLLVTSIESFARYHGVTLDPKSRPVARPSVLASGAAWERQALLRARFCAGDRQLGERVIEVAHIAAYEREAPAAAEVHRLRLRMQQELARERPPERYDLKLGYGGLLDIEFLAQWLQMQRGRDARVRTTDTAQALDALAAAGYLDRADRATLRDAYGFLRRLEQRIHVLHGSGSTVIDVNAPGLAPLARRMDFQDGARVPASAQLVERYRDVTGAVRAVYTRVLGVGD
jgi:[glutamine synthetase] adenylyltransferase / [glutamine synthetase]-adenylyl-L-tyrosine phosphorylase